jgi:GNAT superfamily N-acetyltransferase
VSEVIFEDRERHLVMARSSRFTPELAEFLERIIWGSGGVQYTMHNVAQTLERFKAPQFFSLTEKGQLVGVTTLNQKVVGLGGTSYPAFYAYGIAVDAAKRGRGFGTLLAEQRLRFGLSKVGDKGLTYSYVEATNTSSLKTNLKAGSRSMGQYQVLVINRWRPRDEAGCQRPKAARKEQLVQLLSSQCENHALVDLDQSVDLDHYYTLEQGDEIVAGLQCQRHHLTLTALPGASGRMMVQILPHLPILGSLLPERNLHFLRFGNIYAQRGMEAAIFTLMEALLARHHLNFGMIYLDRRSPVYQRLKAAGRFGLFQALMDVPVQVMACFKGFSESEIAANRDQALFISMMDPV